MSSYADLSFQGVGGLDLHARDYAGAGGRARCPVVCLHGLTRNAADFEDVAPFIAAQGRRVLAVDVRGRGRSARDPDPSRYNPKVYAADVLALLDAAGISRAVFIGTSMGGLITMVIAARRLRAIAAAVLNDVGPVLSMNGLTRIAGYVGQGRPVTSWDEAAEVVRNINGAAFPGLSMQDWQAWARRSFREDGTGQLSLDYDPQIALALRGMKLRTSSLAARLLYRRLARHRPTLLIRGALSDIVGPDEAAYMRRAAPDLHYAEVPGVGHAPLLTEPAAQDALVRFLASVP
ncbi:MAG: alpha/beta hydrolase [Rubrivivax sp.]|nr:alpha/beta hydrolase [Rubrivivax sp.]